MRKLLTCVLMMTLLLAGCAKSGEDSPEQLAAVLRGEYLSLSGWSSQVELTVDYGEQVFSFTVDARWSREGETVLAVTQPELLAGITARIEGGEGVLEYDGAGLSIGLLDGEGLTPIAALPVLMEQITTGYLAQCDWEGEGEGRTLRVLCRDPNLDEGAGTEYVLWFCPDTHALLRAEVSIGGVTRLTALLNDFTMEMTENDLGDHADMG